MVCREVSINGLKELDILESESAIVQTARSVVKADLGKFAAFFKLEYTGNGIVNRKSEYVLQCCDKTLRLRRSLRRSKVCHSLQDGQLCWMSPHFSVEKC